MSISYTRINWQDTAGGETPLNAENLNHMEQGIVDCANAIPSLPLSQQDGGTGVNGTNVAANKVFASPVSGSGEASFRALNQADIPELNASKITLGTLPIERGGTGAGTEQAARAALGAASQTDLEAVQDSVSQDTGWITLTTGTSYCVKMGVCYVNIDRFPISTSGTTQIVARLPEGARPRTLSGSTQLYFRVGDTLSQAWITSAGNITILPPVTGNGSGFAVFPVA